MIISRGVPIPVFIKLNTNTSVWVLADPEYQYQVFTELEVKYYMIIKTQVYNLEPAKLGRYLMYCKAIAARKLLSHFSQRLHQ